jgi:hypothetical protein
VFVLCVHYAVLTKVKVEIIDTLPPEQRLGQLVSRLAMITDRTPQETCDAVENMNLAIGHGVRLLVVNAPISEDGPTNVFFECRSLEALCRIDEMYKSGELKTLFINNSSPLLIDNNRFHIGRLDWKDFKRCAKFFRTWLVHEMFIFICLYRYGEFAYKPEPSSHHSFNCVYCVIPRPFELCKLLMLTNTHKRIVSETRLINSW